ncbi:MAG: sensor domain-containing diguanylate cyclase [Spirochaetaceae bacterium]|nr:MAG: sensor domain-containing diguanylate cyclase [Spirochaetaceae bacterium]
MLHFFDSDSGFFLCQGISLPTDFQAMASTLQQVRVPYDSTEPIAEVFRRSESLLLTDEVRAERPHAFGTRLLNWSIGRTMLFPVAYLGKVVGVLTVFARTCEPTMLETEYEQQDWIALFAAQYERLYKLEKLGAVKALSQAAEQRRFLDFVVQLNNLVEPAELFRQFGSEILRRYPFNLFALLLPDDEKLQLQHIMADQKKYYPMANKMLDWGDKNPYLIEKADGATSLAYIQRTSFHFPDVQEVIHLPMADKDRSGLEVMQTVRSFLIIPVYHREAVVGVLWLISLEAPLAIAESDLHLLEAMSNFLGTAMANAKEYYSVDRERKAVVDLNDDLRNRVRELDTHATRDHLTGLFNLRFFEQRIDLFIEQLRQGQTDADDLSLIIMDIDHFKQFNDTFGHNAGNLVLQGVAQRLNKLVRSMDIPCRYGGEEFVVILPGCGKKVAKRIAERIRADVEGMPAIKGTKTITMSLGCATHKTGESSQQFFVRADKALYEAKNSGRNKVCHAS